MGRYWNKDIPGISRDHPDHKFPSRKSCDNPVLRILRSWSQEIILMSGFTDLLALSWPWDNPGRKCKVSESRMNVEGKVLTYPPVLENFNRSSTGLQLDLRHYNKGCISNQKNPPSEEKLSSSNREGGCYKWDLPPSCTLHEPAPGKCCKTPSCHEPWNTIQFPEGYKEE
ncbi:unnamed protein product [Mytilus edulis]|uniref:Uncharacterized protein n=1 Tax=Mytilus edulis TaxID=6550 RepID=A0A8S3UG09_MYTED|nr:unnamed protein product [Mytilus edulis]